MSIVTVKKKFQVVIPQSLRRQVRVNVGDLLEARIEKGKITFTPKSLVDRRLAEALEDVKQGRTYGPFKTSQEMIQSLHRNVRKLRARKAKRLAR